MAQAAESCRGVVTLDAEGDEKLDSFCWNTLKFLRRNAAAQPLTKKQKKKTM